MGSVTMSCPFLGLMGISRPTIFAVKAGPRTAGIDDGVCEIVAFRRMYAFNRIAFHDNAGDFCLDLDGSAQLGCSGKAQRQLDGVDLAAGGRI